jgi:tetratricopeptide (TPR) repeat protein
MVDKTFTVISDALVEALPGSSDKKAFIIYKKRLESQSNREISAAFKNYFKALQFETNSNSRSFIFFNLRILYLQLNQKHRALLNFHASLRLNPSNCSTLNSIAIIYHSMRQNLLDKRLISNSDIFFNRAYQFWSEIFDLRSTQYFEAKNWINNYKNLMNENTTEF